MSNDPKTRRRAAHRPAAATKVLATGITASATFGAVAVIAHHRPNWQATAAAAADGTEPDAAIDTVLDTEAEVAIDTDSGETSPPGDEAGGESTSAVASGDVAPTTVAPIVVEVHRTVYVGPNFEVLPGPDAVVTSPPTTSPGSTAPAPGQGSSSEKPKKKSKTTQPKKTKKKKKAPAKKKKKKKKKAPVGPPACTGSQC